jgi:hypothetical protein
MGYRSMFQATGMITEIKWPMNWLMTARMTTESSRRDNGTSEFKEEDVDFCFQIIWSSKWALFRFM